MYSHLAPSTSRESLLFTVISINAQMLAPCAAILRHLRPLCLLLRLDILTTLPSMHHHQFLKKHSPISQDSSANSLPSPHATKFPCIRHPSTISSRSCTICITAFAWPLPSPSPSSLAITGLSPDGSASIQINFSRTEGQGNISSNG